MEVASVASCQPVEEALVGAEVVVAELRELAVRAQAGLKGLEPGGSLAQMERGPGRVYSAEVAELELRVERACSGLPVGRLEAGAEPSLASGALVAERSPVRSEVGPQSASLAQRLGEMEGGLGQLCEGVRVHRHPSFPCE